MFISKIAELEEEKRELERQVNEQKAKCEAVEKREIERRQVEEKKHGEEVQFLKRTNQQLKVSKETPTPTCKWWWEDRETRKYCLRLCFTFL